MRISAPTPLNRLSDLVNARDRHDPGTPEGCVASEAEIEQARAVLDGLQQGTAAADSQLIRGGRLK